jgi:uncharacterized membrane protein YqaE (UPF0057 family)
MKKTILILTILLSAMSVASVNINASVIVPSATSSIVPGDPDPAAVKSALKDFRNLSKKEKKERIKEVKTLIKHYKAEKKSSAEGSDNTVLLAILAILLPPLAVYLHQGEINSKFWIDLLLTIIFWLPGVVYALIVIFGNN